VNSRSFILSALIAGAVTGILGNLPVLNLINCFLCIFAWVGGALAVFLYRRFQSAGPELNTRQGAGLGALTGLIGAVIGVVVYLLTSFISTPLFNNLYRTFDPTGNLPFKSGFGQTFIQAVIFLILDAILYTGFGALSALITTSLLSKKPATGAA
jgi:hypothetical protein